MFFTPAHAHVNCAFSSRSTPLLLPRCSPASYFCTERLPWTTPSTVLGSLSRAEAPPGGASHPDRPGLPRLPLSQLWTSNEAIFDTDMPTPGQCFCFHHMRTPTRARRAMRAPFRQLQTSSLAPSFARTRKGVRSPESSTRSSPSRPDRRTPHLFPPTSPSSMPSSDTQFFLHIPAPSFSHRDGAKTIDHVLLAVDAPRAQLTVSP